MEVHTDSKTGPLVPPAADVTAALSRQIDDVKQRWLISARTKNVPLSQQRTCPYLSFL